MRSQVMTSVSGMLVFIAIVGNIGAADVVPSGLAVGAAVSKFLVDDITGPNQGTALCYRCRFGASPVVCVFARETSGSLANLVKKIDENIEANPRLKSFVVIMSAEGDSPAETLRRMAKDARINRVPLTICESIDGPPAYQISPEADITVLMWNQGVVKARRGYRGELTADEIGAIAGDISKILSD